MGAPVIPHRTEKDVLYNWLVGQMGYDAVNDMWRPLAVAASGSLGVNTPAASTLETGTSALTGTWTAIQMVEATVFTTLTGLGGDSSGGVSFPAGMVIYGSFTAVTLASGKVILYS